MHFAASEQEGTPDLGVERAAAVQAASLQGAGGRASPAGLVITTRPDLQDVDHGDWSGLTRTEVEERWPDLYKAWHERPNEVCFPGGECLRDVRARALTFLAAVRQEHAEGNILVVTHGEVLQLLLIHFLQMDPNQLWSMPRDNCALSIVDDYDVPLVMAINDTCHLEGVRSSLSTQVR